MRILVIEDEPKIARAVAAGLGQAGFEVEIAASGTDGHARLQGSAFGLVVLDWMLPGESGLEILRALRTSGDATPVLLLTAKDAVEDRVRGLDAGADDYLVKPFAMSELEARVRALLRRAPEPARRFTVGALEVDVPARQVRVAGAEVSLTLREFELLVYLLRHQDRVVSREMLARDVWEETRRATPLDNVIDVTMARLRKKLEHGDAPRIETVRGVGFVIREVSSA